MGIMDEMELTLCITQYHWADGNQVKKPIKCSAPKYIDFLMTWVQDQLDDESLFPSKIGVPFPNNFLTNAKTILKRLFRVYAHVYHQHFKVHMFPTLDPRLHVLTTESYVYDDACLKTYS